MALLRKKTLRFVFFLLKLYLYKSKDRPRVRSKGGGGGKQEHQTFDDQSKRAHCWVTQPELLSFLRHKHLLEIIIFFSNSVHFSSVNAIATHPLPSLRLLSLYRRHCFNAVVVFFCSSISPPFSFSDGIKKVNKKKTKYRTLLRVFSPFFSFFGKWKEIRPIN